MRRRFPVLAAAVFMLLAGRGARGAAFELTTEELMPFSMTRGDEVTGIATDIVREAFARAGLSARTRLYSWLRAYELARARPNGCVYSTVRTPEREPLFKWVGPLVRDDFVVFVPERSGLSARSIADLRRYRTAGTRGDSLTSFLVRHGIAVSYTPTAGQLQMLARGRIDFWATTLARGRYIAARQGTSLRVLMTLKRSDMYLACNRAVPDRVIDALNGAVRGMKADGTVERLGAAYR